MVELSGNFGKTEAIREGLKYVRSRYTLLLDADLRCLKAREISLAISRIVGDPHIDMIILRRVNAAFNSKISRGDVLFSGERILRTEELMRILCAGPEKYQIEMAINQYMLDNRKCVYWMPSSAKNTYKMDKVGLVAGMMGDIMMMKNMVSYGGLGTYVKQFFFFATQQAPEPFVP
jgi:glycosyltransferase involved in cell wall biosynthesis